jgi:hypothetical protein
MTNRDTQLTDEQMNELVLADVNDPSAWGDPIKVRASKGRRRIRHAKHLELASKFYVLSVLHRLGADATLTFSQSDNVDITVVLESGNALTVDVKTLSGAREWRVADFRARRGHFLTFVRYPATTDPNTPPDVYIVASQQLADFLANRLELRARELGVSVEGSKVADAVAQKFDDSEDTVSLDLLDVELHARDAWERLVVPNAA